MLVLNRLSSDLLDKVEAVLDLFTEQPFIPLGAPEAHAAADSRVLRSRHEGNAG
ncbi:hypothetical protein [Subtercola endophyticus]|uniref:hypothetical protein n=1 Tax=Subtercola endophyticus TaxID=2895559 RepID=UPI001E40951A|nr:hypothetical protein [Subtercola endophyticus]UFS59620.1 hypothetical protein LQ955_02120 [Subtercola endophyticus]